MIGWPGLALLALVTVPGAGHADDLAAMQASTVRLFCAAEPNVYSGSGFVVGAGTTTVIATARHVAACGDGVEQKLVVLLARGETVPARLVWSDTASDLALVRTRPLGRPAVGLADTAGVVAGAPVTVVGFPRIADLVVDGGDPAVPSVTRGNISRISVGSASGVRYFQHSAATNPGNSGGPVFDGDGNVIGVNSVLAIAGDAGNGGIAAAVDIAELIPQLHAEGIDGARSVPTISTNMALAGLAAAIVLLVGAASFLIFRRRASRAAPPGVGAAIHIVAGPLAGMRVPVVSPVILGRDPAGAQIVYPGDDTSVSRRHCRVGFDRTSGQFEVVDLDSRNGTFVAATVPRRLAANVVTTLAPGTRLLIGSPRNAVVVELG